MKNEFRYDSSDMQSKTVEPVEMRPNMIYDAAPREPETDEPIIVIKPDKLARIDENPS